LEALKAIENASEYLATRIEDNLRARFGEQSAEDHARECYSLMAKLQTNVSIFRKTIPKSEAYETLQNFTNFWQDLSRDGFPVSVKNQAVSPESFRYSLVSSALDRWKMALGSLQHSVVSHKLKCWK
jgi:hypothetical protein